MWINPPTPVTISNIIQLSGSKRNPSSIFRSPMVNHSSGVISVTLFCPKVRNRPTVKRNDKTTAPIDNRALNFPSPCVNKVMIIAAPNGSSKIIQAKSSGFSILEFHGCQVLDVGGRSLAIKRDDQRQANGNFSSRHSDDKKDQDLPVEIVVEPGESYQREVACVEHQFQRHI